MNLSDWKQAAQRSAATEKLQLVIAQRSAALHSAAQRSPAQRSVCVNGPLGDVMVANITFLSFLLFSMCQSI